MISQRSSTLLLLIVAGFAVTLAQNDEAAVHKLLNDQVEAWNAGDVEGYMKGYWESDSTVFISGANLVKGYREVLGRYKKSYNTREKMGKLEFADLQVRKISAATALAMGIWRLHRLKDQPWGRFTLVIEKKPDGWRIVYDHTSTASQ